VRVVGPAVERQTFVNVVLETMDPEIVRLAGSMRTLTIERPSALRPWGKAPVSCSSELANRGARCGSRLEESNFGVELERRRRSIVSVRIDPPIGTISGSIVSRTTLTKSVVQQRVHDSHGRLSPTAGGSRIHRRVRHQRGVGRKFSVRRRPPPGIGRRRTLARSGQRQHEVIYLSEDKPVE